MDQSFVHLHVHTHYSLLDGATRIDDLVARAKKFDQPAVAITDHGNMFGAIEFYLAARKVGIKPIIGCETYLAARNRRVKTATNDKDAFHQLLLAMNLTGYHNLIRLASIGYTEGFYRKPRIDKEVLAEYSEGLICTSTCLSGEIPAALLKKDRAAAEELAKTYLEIFGPDRFFIELQDHGIADQQMINPELLDMADRLGVAAIVTNDVHYLDHAHAGAHDVLCCINTGAQVSDEDRFKFKTDQYYFKSTAEMADVIPGRPELLANTLHVADMCNLELDLTQRHAPVFRVPDEITDDAGQRLTDGDYLRRLVYKGADERYDEITAELRERIDYELEVITSKGFASYFLIVWDCVNFAREQGIPVGARGSGCSAVVAHCLYISDPDPIRYGLYFERFMDPDRDEMPDIDLDICQVGRSRLIEYVRVKYGHVAQIITFNTLKAKAAVKDVARVMGMGFTEASELTKLIPADLKMTIDKALKQEPELKKRYKDDPQVKKIFDTARTLEGVARNAGIHAAGVVVADEPLDNFLPLYKAAGSDVIVTQYDGPTVERCGLLKMDFLGLRTLTTLERARQLAEAGRGKTIDLNAVGLEDPKVYELYAKGDTKGIFQFESGGMREVIMRMKPNRIEDLIAANALFRPGPMEYIPEYIARKHGEHWTTPHPIMTEVLEETYGIMVYQEQVSRLVNRLGGIELKRAFRLAKAISKKKTSMIEAMRGPFIDGCQENGVKKETAEQIFNDILKFGGYAFNKAHSTGYAILSYKTAWMKTYYPVEFMAAVMSFEMSNTEKIAEYRRECGDIGIRVDPPCINASEWDFSVDRHEVADNGTRAAAPEPSRGAPVAATKSDGDGGGDGSGTASGGGGKVRGPSIRFGLGAIKGVGEKAAAAIIDERHTNGPFRSLFDFCERVDPGPVNRAVVENLIQAGAFDRTGAMRKALFDAVDRALSAGQAAARDRKSGQMSMFGDPGETADPIVREAELSNAEWSESEMLAREKSVLGIYMTSHPLASHEALLEACSTARVVDLAGRADGDEVTLGGMIVNVRTITTKSGRSAGKALAIVTIEDLTGHTEAIVFSELLATHRADLVPDAIVFLKGKVDRKREEPSIRVEEVITEKEAIQRLGAYLCLTVNSAEPMDDVLRLVKRHHGDSCKIVFNVRTADGLIAEIEAHASFGVECSDALLGGLVDLLGKDAVSVRNANLVPIPFDAGRSAA